MSSRRSRTVPPPRAARVPQTITPNRSIFTREEAMDPARAPMIVLMISQMERNMAAGGRKEADSADPYPRQAGVLAGAEQGGGSQSHVMQGSTHQAFCQFRRIAFCAQVGQHYVFRASWAMRLSRSQACSLERCPCVEAMRCFNGQGRLGVAASMSGS